MWIADNTQGCTWVNKPWLDMTGRTIEEELGDGWTELIHPDDIERCLNVYQEAFRSRREFEIEYRLRRSDGEYRWLLDRGVPLIKAGGGFDGYTGVAIDITDRVAGEESSARYGLLADESTDIIWFVRTDGSFYDVNRAAIETYGYSKEEFLKLSLWDIRHPQTLGDVPEQLETADAEGVFFESLHIKRDGTAFPVEVRANGTYYEGERLVMAIVRDISERKQHENLLRESEERRQLAQEAGNVGIFDWNIENNETYWSEIMWSLYGEEPGGNPDDAFWLAHLHPNDAARMRSTVQSVIRSSEDQFRDEFSIVRTDGAVRWIEVKAKIDRNEAGVATRMYGVNLDITERKEHEQRLRLSENQLRLVMNTVPALISYVDREERYRFVNGKLIEWFEQTDEQLVGRKVRDVIGAVAYRVIKPFIDECLSGKESTFETLLLYKTAGPRYVHGSFVPDIGIDGKVHGYYELTRDLTDIKRSEDLLRFTEDRLRLLMDSLTDHAIFSLDIDGLIDSWNRGAEFIFGYSQQEILGQPVDIIFTDQDRDRGVPAKERKQARKDGRASDQRWHVRRDGTKFFADGMMMPLYAGSVLTGYAKIASDLTEKKRRDEELQRAHDELEDRVTERTKELVSTNEALVNEMEERASVEAQRSDLLRRLVTSQELERRRIARDLHDQLGQRLTALRLKIASLKEVTGDPELLAKRVQRLQEIAEKLDSEVSFLAWELRPSALDDLGLAEAIGAFVNEWSRHYDVAADFRSGKLPVLRPDREFETHLYRITQEALNNIAKHAFANHVSVLLESRDESVILIIEDDGKGFEAAKLSKPRESGKGLGLLGMRERASLIGGDVEIESAPGKGTTIYVRIPIF
jgi:PAS domain S-box-containing protein